MNRNERLGQTHRRLSIVVALAKAEPAVRISYVPLLPLALLLVTGLDLFALPYTTRWRVGRSATAREQ